MRAQSRTHIRRFFMRSGYHKPRVVQKTTSVHLPHHGPYSETTLNAQVEFEFEILVNFTLKNATRNLSLS